jgi:hypothetical protein
MSYVSQWGVHLHPKIFCHRFVSINSSAAKNNVSEIHCRSFLFIIVEIACSKKIEMSFGVCVHPTYELVTCFFTTFPTSTVSIWSCQVVMHNFMYCVYSRISKEFVKNLFPKVENYHILTFNFYYNTEEITNKWVAYESTLMLQLLYWYQ